MTQEFDDQQSSLHGSVNQPEKVPAPKKSKRFRSAETGEFVTRDEAEENPATTVSETVASKD